MAKSKRNFIKGRMNKSLDERLVPNGEYVDAMNVRLGSTEESEVGSVESTKGNELLTSINLGVFNTIEYDLSNDAKCIGAFEDGANETIYWFIHDSNQPSTATGKADLIVSFNINTNSTEYHVVSFQNAADPLNTTLNFNPQYLITEVNMVDNLLFFTDNYNPPRKINIAKNYAYPTAINSSDLFLSSDILVIVKPPAQAPQVKGVISDESNYYLEDKFICFGYRYKYEDNEYSATSPFSNPVFSPHPFNLSVESNLNEGMLNQFTSAEVTFNSGDIRVTDIEILVKESNSSQIRVIEKINKLNSSYLDNTEYNFLFTDSKVFKVLSSGEILRLYDNVPLKAKTQTLMGNRLMYGNYVENYNLERDNSNTNIDYSTELISSEIGTTTITNSSASSHTYNLVNQGSVSSNAKLTVPLDSIENKLQSGAVLTINFRVSHNQFSGAPSPHPIGTNENIFVGFSYTLKQDFDSVSDMVNSNDFQRAIGVSSNIASSAFPTPDYCNGDTFTDSFNCQLLNSISDVNGVAYVKNESGITAVGQPISATVNLSNLELTIPAMAYVKEGQSSFNNSNAVFEYFDIESVSCFFQQVSSPISLHSNRGYQVGIVYMDEFNRATTVITSPDNTVNVPSDKSVFVNKVKVTIPTSQIAPKFATRYKFAIKPDAEKYESIFTRFYYTDPNEGYTYFLLQGENISKVEEGDVLIVKKDTLGAVPSLVKVNVLEKKSQSENFITDVESPAGVYMKILANNFSVSKSEGTDILPGQQSKEENAGSQNVALQYKGLSTTDSSGNLENQDIPAGSIIKIDFDLYRNQQGNGNKCEYRKYRLKKEFVSPNDYDDIIAWWEGQNIGDIIDTGTEKQPSSIQNVFIDTVLTTNAQIQAFEQGGQFATNRYQWFRDGGNANGEIRFLITGTDSCPGSGGDANIRATFEVFRSGNIIAFETEPSEALPDLWYEGQDTYPINQQGFHLDGGNFANVDDQDQTSSQPAILHLNFGNCFTFGNGVESFTIKDSIKTKSMELGNRAIGSLQDEYKQSHKKFDITYSGIYNDETNLNRLNEFNLGLANFKPLEESFGNLNKLYGRETDVLTLQEDKISYVLSGKNLLSDASGGDVLTSVPEVLGKQIARIEEFGISNNTESFAAYGYDKYFTDAKRGALIQLKGATGSSEQLIVISEIGMKSWFRDLFKDNFKTQKLGAYDPYMNEYVLANNDTQIPFTVDCIPCGQRQSFLLKPQEESSFCVETDTGIGDVTINFQVNANPLLKLKVNYNGQEVINQSISSLGSVTFSKNVRSVNKYTVTLTNTGASGGVDADFNLTTSCVVGVPLEVVDIVLTNDEDANKSIHHGWRYSDGASLISSPEVPTVFESSNKYIKSSFYEVYAGNQGEGSIPIKTQDLTMRTIKYSSDTYDVKNTNRFGYHTSNTLYSNTPADLLTLAGNLTLLTPTVSGANREATFTVPSGNYTYLYLVWDLRLLGPKTLCSDPSSVQAICCDCGCASTNTEYIITNSSNNNIQITYTNTSGTSQSQVLPSGNRSVTICSQSYPVIQPATANVSIVVSQCNCS